MWKKLSVISLSVIVSLFMAEILIRTFTPQRILYPKWNLVNIVGREHKPDITMVHTGPRFKYEYKINVLGHRGETLISQIWCIGDSYCFGYGVDTTYSELIGALNLGVGGDGLMQETSRFLTYSLRNYAPGICVLQFCSNDIYDPYLLEDPPLPSDFTQWIADCEYLQKSHIYKLVQSALTGTKESEKSYESIYCALLDTFSQYLDHNNIRLLFIDVNYQSFQFDMLRVMIDSSKHIEYVNTSYQEPSPEGHQWGQQAHRNIADSLRKVL